MARRPDQSQKILDAALALAAERGWRNLTMREIAAAAGLPLARLYASYPSRFAILAGLLARTDEAVLSGAGDLLAEEPRRDRLFDLLMRRFDALAPHKDGVRAMLHDVPRNPVDALAAAPGLLRAMAWMLQAAGVPTDGLSGLVRVKALTVVYLSTLRVWMQDDSPDMARTMAALDRNLGRAGRALRL